MITINELAEISGLPVEQFFSLKDPHLGRFQGIGFNLVYEGSSDIFRLETLKKIRNALPLDASKNIELLDIREIGRAKNGDSIKKITYLIPFPPPFSPPFEGMKP